MSLDLQIEKGTPRPEVVKVTPTLKFTSAQMVNDEKRYSLKDIYEACSKVEVQPTTQQVQQPITRG